MMNQSKPEMKDRKDSPEGFVDIHTHLVPGVDDGAACIEDSYQMLNQAWESGTAVLAATPHVYPGVQKDKEIEGLLQARDQWVEYASKKFPQVHLMAGAEIHCTHDLYRVLSHFGSRLALNGGSYVLLEFPFDMLFPGVDELLFLLQKNGWIPVIAHPERNAVIQRNPEVLSRMVSGGALAQVNTGSLAGWFGEAPRRSAVQLLRRNLVHVVASDAHWPGERPADLSGVPTVLEELGLTDPDWLLRRNPWRVLQNKELEPMPELNPQPENDGGLFSRLVRHLRNNW